jgi:hypothetical protein
MGCSQVTRARGLRDRGIPVDGYELNRTEAEYLALWIEEEIGVAFNLGRGGAGCVSQETSLLPDTRPVDERLLRAT